MHTFIKTISLVVGMFFLSSCSSNNDDNAIVDNTVADDGDTQTYVKVYSSDNSTHCGSIGIDLDVMELDLINLGIDVVCSQKGHDGAVREEPPLCGSRTGNINIYKIYSENVSDAESIGFSPVHIFIDYQDRVCE